MLFSIFDIFYLPTGLIIEDSAAKAQSLFFRFFDLLLDFSMRPVLEYGLTMSRRRRGLFFLGVFAVFLFATLFINFFHTEKGLRPDSSCPACHFQTSSLAVGLSLTIILPRLLLVAVLSVWESKLEIPAVLFDLVSRPPPLV